MIISQTGLTRKAKVNQIMKVLQGDLSERWRTWALLTVLALAVSPVGAQNPASNRADLLRDVAARLEDNRRHYGADSNRFVRPGLLADRTGRWVRIDAEACGHKSPTPTEFYLVTARSGHDYEALAVSFAAGRDLHDALEFIGLPAGQPIDAAARRYWPKGERVQARFAWTDSNGTHQAAAEEMILDLRTGRPLPPRGLVFTGSRIVRLPGTDQTGYAADEREPQALAANFNHPDLVLDVPYQALQGDEYSHLVPNPQYPLAKGQPLTVTFTPEYPDGRRRVQELTLTLRPPAPDAPAVPRFDLSGDPVLRLTNAALPALLAAFGQIVESGRDPYVTLAFTDDLTLLDAQAAARLLISLENDRGIRIDAPRAGDIYYRALLSQESHRQRQHRPTQPWELHWSLPTPDSGTGTLVRLEEIWDDAKNDFTLRVTEFPIRRPEEAAAILRQEGGTRVVFAFLPADLPYAQIRAWAQAVQQTHPTLYLYAETANGERRHE